MTFSSTLVRLDLDAKRLPYSLLTAVAACAALLIGWAFGSEHPQWSVMTGIVTALVVGLISTPQGACDPVIGGTRRLTSLIRLPWGSVRAPSEVSR